MKIDDPRWDKAIEAFNDGDWAGALYLLRSMAKDEIPAAYSKIAYIYEYGYNGKYGPNNGVDQDYAKALEWYEKAYHEARDVTAAVGLARLYFRGQGVSRDENLAFCYLSDVKKYQIAEVYYMLGVMYHTGNGVELDLEKAKKLYMRAMIKGQQEALVPIGGIIGKSGQPLRGLCIQIYALIKSMIKNLKEAA